MLQNKSISLKVVRDQISYDLTIKRDPKKQKQFEDQMATYSTYFNSFGVFIILASIG